MFTPIEVINKFKFLIKNHKNNLAVSYYKWIIKAIELEQEYYTICTVSGKNVYSHFQNWLPIDCLLYTSPSPRDRQKSRMPSSA